jgi:hypothetical protein
MRAAMHEAAIDRTPAAHNPGDGRRWFILVCKAGREKLAGEYLISKKMQPYAPVISEIRDYSARGYSAGRPRQRHVDTSAIPGIVFLRWSLHLDHEKRDALKRCPGFQKFLWLWNNYVVVRDDDMSRFKVECDKRARCPEPQSTIGKFEPGDKVQIPGSEETGTFIQYDKKGQTAWLNSLTGWRLRVSACQIVAP